MELKPLNSTTAATQVTPVSSENEKQKKNSNIKKAAIITASALVALSAGGVYLVKRSSAAKAEKALKAFQQEYEVMERKLSSFLDDKAFNVFDIKKANETIAILKEEALQTKNIKKLDTVYSDILNLKTTYHGDYSYVKPEVHPVFAKLQSAIQEKDLLKAGKLNTLASKIQRRDISIVKGKTPQETIANYLKLVKEPTQKEFLKDLKPHNYKNELDFVSMMNYNGDINRFAQQKGYGCGAGYVEISINKNGKLISNDKPLYSASKGKTNATTLTIKENLGRDNNLMFSIGSPDKKLTEAQKDLNLIKENMTPEIKEAFRDILARNDVANYDVLLSMVKHFADGIKNAVK